MKNIDRLAGKRKVIAMLGIEAASIISAMIATPGYAEAMADRQRHIERGELWITPESIKLAPLYVRLAAIHNKANAVAATPSKLFRENGTIDKRRAKRARRGTKTITIKFT